MRVDRRTLLAIVTGAGASLAGCAGDGSIEEIEAGIEETNDHLESVDPTLETAAGSIDDEEWEACSTAVEEIRNDLDAARESSGEALSLAEEGHSEHATVLRRQREYVEILASMADEIEAACEAGRTGDGEELERRWETVQDLDDDRHAKREEIQNALEALR